MNRKVLLFSVAAAIVLAGCGGDAKVDLAAADALILAASRMRTALDEYHAEIEQADDRRESDVVQAFVDRVRRDAQDTEKLDRHSDQFSAALSKIRDDRRVESRRRDAADTHVEAVQEVARGLRRIGIDSLTLQDEMRRYLKTWMEKGASRPATTVQGEP